MVPKKSLSTRIYSWKFWLKLCCGVVYGALRCVSCRLHTRALVPETLCRGFDSLVLLVSWEIWKKRNRRTFDDKSISTTQLLCLTWTEGGARSRRASASSTPPCWHWWPSHGSFPPRSQISFLAQYNHTCSTVQASDSCDCVLLCHMLRHLAIAYDIVVLLNSPFP